MRLHHGVRRAGWEEHGTEGRDSPGSCESLQVVDDSVAQVADRIAHRVLALVERRGLGPDADPEEVDLPARDEPLLASLYGASVAGRIATGPHAGQRVLAAGNRIDDGYREVLTGPRCANVPGFSLQANVAVPAQDRRDLERLCRERLRHSLRRRVPGPVVIESDSCHTEGGDYPP